MSDFSDETLYIDDEIVSDLDMGSTSMEMVKMKGEIYKLRNENKQRRQDIDDDIYSLMGIDHDHIRPNKRTHFEVIKDTFDRTESSNTVRNLKTEVHKLQKQNKKAKKEIAHEMRSYNKNEKKFEEYKMMEAYNENMYNLQSMIDHVKRKRERKKQRRFSGNIRDKVVAAKMEKSDKRAKEWAQMVAMEAEQNKLIKQLNELNANASEWKDRRPLITDNDDGIGRKEEDMIRMRRFYENEIETVQNKKDEMMKTMTEWNKVWREGTNGGNVGQATMQRDIKDASPYGNGGNIGQATMQRDIKDASPYGIEISDVKQVTIFNSKASKAKNSKKSAANIARKVPMRNDECSAINELRMELEQCKKQNGEFLRTINELKISYQQHPFTFIAEKKPQPLVSKPEPVPNKEVRGRLFGEHLECKVEAAVKQKRRIGTANHFHFETLLNKIKQTHQQNEVLHAKYQTLRGGYDRIAKCQNDERKILKNVTGESHHLQKSIIDYNQRLGLKEEMDEMHKKIAKIKSEQEFTNRQRYKSLENDNDHLFFLEKKYAQLNDIHHIA